MTNRENFGYDFETRQVHARHVRATIAAPVFAFVSPRGDEGTVYGRGSIMLIRTTLHAA